MKVKTFLIILLNLFGLFAFFPLENAKDPLEIITEPTENENKENKTEMLKHYSNVQLIQQPLFQGRNCLIKETGKIEYREEPFQCLVQGECSSCFTQMERCASITPRTKQYGDCYYTYTEAPYKCCYVGNGKTNRCIPIDPSDTKVFKETIFHMRAYDGDFQSNYEIECSAKITTYSLILSFLYLSLIFF